MAVHRAGGCLMSDQGELKRESLPIHFEEEDTVVPVIKVATNSRLYQHMRDNIDINAGEILDGTASIESIGERIFQEIIEVASGKVTKAEILGHHEFAIHSLGLSV